MGNENTVLDAASARHLIRRTGFGATPADVAAVIGRSRGAAADQLFAYALKPPRLRLRGRSGSELHDSWLKTLLKPKAPLQMKLTLFWHDHFATAVSRVENVRAMAGQIATLAALGAGSMKTLVRAMNRDAAMIEFLDTVRNRKQVPNENYARELQELFTLGVTDEAGAQNYTQDDIVQIARAFTGWTYDPLTARAFFDPARHDFAADWPARGAKVIYRTTGGFGPAGRSFAVAGEGEAEIDTVTDILFDHTDSTGHSTVARRIARRLLEFFAHPDPALAVVDAVVAASHFATSGHPNQWNVAALVRAILCHDAFYDTAAAAPFLPTVKKSVRWPVDFVLATLRTLSVKPKSRYLYIDGGSGRPLYEHLTNMGQRLLDPPSVFGWDWETGWISSATLLARFEFVNDVIRARYGAGSSFKPGRVMDLTRTDPGDIVDAVTTVLGIDDQLTAAERQVFIDYLTDDGAVASLDLTADFTQQVKLRGLFEMAMYTPHYQVH